MFEDVGVFERVGEGTDVVRKEMYDFEDKGGRRIALRPEGTASVVRAYVQHRPPVPFKAWYVAPNFRYERPQAGRYRQHHQLGVEVLGTDDPDLDVEVIALAWSVARDLGLTRVDLLLNSLGDDACRPAYLDALRAFLEHAGRAVRRAPRARRRQPAAGPRLQAAGVPGRPPTTPPAWSTTCATRAPPTSTGSGRPRRARRAATASSPGWCGASTTTPAPRSSSPPSALDSAQNAVGGGGRYDGLVEELGGPPTPGIGFGMGIERLLLACDAEGVFPTPGRPGRRVRGRHRRRGRRRRPHRRAAGGRDRRRPGLRRPVDEGADQGGRPVRRPAGPDRRRAGGGRGHGHRAGPAHGTTRRSSPGRRRRPRAEALS